jgi:hypothetical protein
MAVAHAAISSGGRVTGEVGTLGSWPTRSLRYDLRWRAQRVEPGPVRSKRW